MHVVWTSTLHLYYGKIQRGAGKARKGRALLCEVTQRRASGVALNMSALAKVLAIEAGKHIIRRVIKGRRMSFCPHCGRKVFIRGRSK